MVATNSTGLTVTMLSDREVVLRRVFDAPRRLVFEAFTKPEHLVRWFGPRGYTLPVCEIDLRPGGAWRYVLRGPDGEEMGMKGVYREIAAPERLVSTEAYDIPGMGWTPESVVTTTLEERDGQTTLTSRILYQSVEHRDGHVGSGMEAGAAETFDRLAELLGSMS
jgi:uncharacterized protein YndB with AHSA1/START domain